MARLIPSPWGDHFNELVSAAQSNLRIASPFVALGACRRIIRAVEARGRAATLNLAILTDLSLDNLMSGATDAVALIELANAVPHTEIRILPSLHAKVYVADVQAAVITSSNLTENGILRNIEYGVWMDDPADVRAVKDDLTRYALMGSPVNQTQLRTFATITADLREIASAAERTVKRGLRREFQRRMAAAGAELLRARAAGRTAHAIFSDAIIYLLHEGPMRTVLLHEHIKRIHPDLCDDSVDLVIDGQHFGKRWKHSVRTAQVYLRRSGRIRRVGNQWHLIRR